MKKVFNTLAHPGEKELIFGRAKYPLKTRKGLVIGGGKVYPELNFTLPPMNINAQTLPEIKNIYRSVITDACDRALELNSPGLVVELELLIEMTLNPDFAYEITAVIAEELNVCFRNRGLKTAFRVTPNDIRDKNRPPVMRSGELLNKILITFEKCAKAGGELLSIESTGGKEIHDDALLNCDLEKAVFALSIMGARDMEFLWEKIYRIAKDTNTVAAGDTACGFANTAMVLAQKKFIPRIFAALDRVAAIPRSLVAYEQGAVGPGKDCGYENPFLKAITGYPMSMEGKTAACAHSSPLGNIAGAVCDLWSNESVQNIKLLGGMAPTVSLEQLIYDCRLMNQTDNDSAFVLRDLMIRSDAYLDPQAYIFKPENIIAISKAIVNQPSPYLRTKAAVETAFDILHKALKEGELTLPPLEESWIHLIEESIQRLPSDEQQFIEQIMPKLDSSKFIAGEYDL